MRVLFFITVRGHGRGGHFHSLNHVASAIGESLETGIYSLGNGRSEIIEKNSHFLGHLYFNGRNLFSFRSSVKKNVCNFKPDIIHCFDVNAFNILSIFLGHKKYRIILNKCGGPNPLTFPFVSNVILFSMEDVQWFRNNPKFLNANIYLIPNRVDQRELLFDDSAQLLEKEDAFCFVRIARVGNTYRKSIEDAIRLIDKLKRDKGCNVHLYLIGTIEDETVLAEIKSKCANLPISILTKDIYTQKASNMLYLADAVIATGRGIMEGTGLGKPILTPAINCDLPLLVTDDNFNGFFATNFSQRNVAAITDINLNFDKILNMIENKGFYNQLKGRSKDFFRQHFDVSSGVSLYLDVYAKVVSDNHFKASRFLNITHQFRTIYSFLRK